MSPATSFDDVSPPKTSAWPGSHTAGGSLVRTTYAAPLPSTCPCPSGPTTTAAASSTPMPIGFSAHPSFTIRPKNPTSRPIRSRCAKCVSVIHPASGGRLKNPLSSVM